MSANLSIPTIGVSKLVQAHATPVLDVRSPSEFRKGHIAHAKNTPLFSDEERSEIGTLYKQHSVDAAIARGRAIANSKTIQLLKSVREHVSDGEEFIMHCWRGGMRSEGFARLCIEHGLRPRLLVGGYKAFRNYVAESFLQPMPLVVVSGSTGCGKTELLKQLWAVGEQVIDLESIAGHKGSAFGGIGQPVQPTVEQFENRLFEACRTLERNRPVWIEDESRSIGHICLPDAFWNQLSSAPTIVISSHPNDRIDRLVAEYGQLPTPELVAAIARLRKRLGGQRFQAAIACVEAGNIAEAIATILEYYDKAYAKALAARPGVQVNVSAAKVPLDQEAIENLQELGQSLIVAL